MLQQVLYLNLSSLLRLETISKILDHPVRMCSRNTVFGWN